MARSKRAPEPFPNRFQAALQLAHWNMQMINQLERVADNLPAASDVRRELTRLHGLNRQEVDRLVEIANRG